MSERRIDPNHGGPQAFLRVVGPIVLVIGIILMVIGIGSFFASFGSFGPPKYFWCAFLGMPMAAAGGIMTKFGYLGRISRYLSEEISPVAKDTFNYMADGTQEGVRTATRAVAQGLTEGGVNFGGGSGGTTKIRCHKCNELVDADARFCDQCGAALEKSKPCPQCTELNDPDARFCDNCGYAYN